MQNSHCSLPTKNKIIKIHEPRSSTIYIDNQEENDFFLIEYDGCIVNNKTGADFILAPADLSCLTIIELKGGEVKDAYYQIVETTKHLNSNGYQKIKKSAVIVNRSWPKATLSVQTLQSQYARSLKSKLFAVRHLEKKKYSEIS